MVAGRPPRAAVIVTLGVTTTPRRCHYYLGAGVVAGRPHRAERVRGLSPVGRAPGAEVDREEEEVMTTVTCPRGDDDTTSLRARYTHTHCSALTRISRTTIPQSHLPVEHRIDREEDGRRHDDDMTTT